MGENKHSQSKSLSPLHTIKSESMGEMFKKVIEPNAVLSNTPIVASV